MGIADKIVSIIGIRKHINQDELVQLKEEFGDEAGDKIYEMAGNGSRISKSEMADIVKWFAGRDKQAKADVIEMKTKVEGMDIEQNRKLEHLSTKIGRMGTIDLGYMGELLNDIRQLVKVLEQDVIRLADRVKVLESKNDIE